MAKEKLKRELEREALARIEDAARTPEDFENVTKWWDRLDANRERKERYYEIGCEIKDEPQEWEDPQAGAIFPPAVYEPLPTAGDDGDFIDTLFNCPYEMHELVEDADLSELIHKLSENHKEVLFYSAVHLYDCAWIAALRGQSDRNIRKVRALLVYNLQRKLLERLNLREQRSLSLTTTERAFLEARKSPPLTKARADDMVVI